jgi:hypothetical protein
MPSPYDGPLLALPFAGTTAPGKAQSPTWMWLPAHGLSSRREP